MKKLVIGFCFLSLTTSSFAQKVLYEVKLKEDKVPVEIIAAKEKDFKGYAVTEYDAVPVKLIDDDMVVTQDKDFDPGNYQTYQVKMLGKETELDAYYNKDGKLISTYENIKDKELPEVIDRAIFKKFPHARIVADRYVSERFLEHGQSKVRYHVKVKSDGKTYHMDIDGNGNVLET